MSSIILVAVSESETIIISTSDSASYLSLCTEPLPLDWTESGDNYIIVGCSVDLSNGVFLIQRFQCQKLFVLSLDTTRVQDGFSDRGFGNLESVLQDWNFSRACLVKLTFFGRSDGNPDSIWTFIGI
jgi:hypothetical protein